MREAPRARHGPYTGQEIFYKDDMRTPIKKFKQLFHVGDLSVQPASHSRSSHEGPCLSVSRVPNAWRTIARLGEAPLWVLTKAAGRFLDMHQVNEALKSVILQWGYDQGYAFEGRGWITELASDEEDEDDEPRYATSETHALAIRDCGEDDDDEVANRYTRAMPFATEKLTAYAEQKVELCMVFDMLALAYAEQVLDLDGLYWNERLDVYAYSAPRAGLLRSKMSSWAIMPAPAGFDTNEEND